jgi:hypothetical protein
MRVEADTRKDSFMLLGNFHGTSAVLQIRSRRDNERDTGFGGPAYDVIPVGIEFLRREMGM